MSSPGSHSPPFCQHFFCVGKAGGELYLSACTLAQLHQPEGQVHTVQRHAEMICTQCQGRSAEKPNSCRKHLALHWGSQTSSWSSSVYKAVLRDTTCLPLRSGTHTLHRPGSGQHEVCRSLGSLEVRQASA